MGGNAHLIAIVERREVAVRALDVACARLRQLEARWSRFRPDSELCRLNLGGGRPVPVSADTRLLMRWCESAWRRSGGRFDPSVLDALERHGYDRTFDHLEGTPAASNAMKTRAAAARGCAQIHIDDAAGTVTLPAGLRLDPGGIGKGLAGDLVTAAMLSAGAVGACANLAGDVRVRGAGPANAHDTWVIGVEHPTRPSEILAILRLPPSGGAVASSSVLIRRWAEAKHHIIDPARGQPSTSDVLAATVVADDGAWADAATKIALAGSAHRAVVKALDDLDIAAVLLLRDETVVTTRAFRREYGHSASET